MFDTIKGIHQKSYQEHGGEYIPRDDHERTCAIRLPPNRFFEEGPPKQLHFRDKRIPRHVTYAYKRNATIAENKDFYTLPENQKRKVDILFLIANSAVSSAFIP